MRTICLAALAASASAGLLTVPGGRQVDEACVYNTDNKPINLADYPPCTNARPVQRKQTYAISINTGSNNAVMTQMNTSWNVPTKPAHYDGQVVYFWPGFKAQHPEMGFPVLQPVLQYGQHGPNWELQSWFVHGATNNVFTAKALKDVRAGDQITSFMQYLPASDEWVCSATLVRTGEISYLRFKAERIHDVKFNYAMLVLETITPNEGCDLYPVDNSVTFTNVVVNNKVVGDSDYKRVFTEHQCHQNITQTAPGVVKFSWHQ